MVSHTLMAENRDAGATEMKHPATEHCTWSA